MATAAAADAAALMTMLDRDPEGNDDVVIDEFLLPPPHRKQNLACVRIAEGNTLLHVLACARPPGIRLVGDILRADRVLKSIERAVPALPLSPYERRAALLAVWLLQCGGNACSRNDVGMTPLHVAAGHGRILFAEVLLAFTPSGSDLVDASDCDGNTAMHYAADKGHGNLFWLLSEKWKGDWTKRNMVGRAPAWLLIKRLLQY